MHPSNASSADHDNDKVQSQPGVTVAQWFTLQLQVQALESRRPGVRGFTGIILS